MLIACAQRRELNLEILLSLAHCLCGISFAIVPRRGLMAQKFYYYYLSTTCFIVSTQIETEKLKNQFVNRNSYFSKHSYSTGVLQRHR
jgi:hypothetical protein